MKPNLSERDGHSPVDKKSGVIPSDAERQLQLVAEHVSAAIAHIARDGADLQYRFVNRRYAELYGRTQADILGCHPREVLGEAVYAEASHHMDQALAGQPVEFDVELPATLTETRVLHVSYSPEFDRSGKVIGFVGIIVDITERKKLEKAVCRLQQELAR